MKYLINIIVLFTFNQCVASDSLIVRYLGIEQGLSNNAVTCIYQDHKGFLWFGTYDGLNKYDGYSFEVYRNIIGDTSSPLDNHIYSLGSDDKNNIWVGNAKGINVYDPVRSTFFVPRFKKNNSSQTFTVNSSVLAIQRLGADMLIGTVRNGLILFQKGSFIGEQIPFPENNDTNHEVSCISYDSLRKTVWVFINGLGLFRFDARGRNLIQVASNVRQCNCIFIKAEGTVYIGTARGAFKLDKNELIPLEQFTGMSVRKIIKDKDDGIQIATDGNGLWYLPPGTDKATPYLTKGKALNSNSIYDIYIDPDNREWIGTLRGGIDIIERNNDLFTTVSYNKLANKDDANDFILSFCEDDKSNLWIGTDGAGLRYWNRKNNTFTEYAHNASPNSISSNFITSIIRDKQNNIWLSTWFGGINRLIPGIHSFKHYLCYNPIKKYSENNIWYLYEDKENRLWAAASSEGALYLYNSKTDNFDLFDNSLSNLQTIAEDSLGNLWVGTSNALVLIDPVTRNDKVYDIGYSVRSIHEDKFHSFWIGTEGGGLLLFNRQTGKYTRFTTNDGLPNNTILRILEDKHGNLWLSTYYGLSRFSPKTKVFRNFTQSDGLQSNQFSYNAAIITKGGAFLFGGIKGFNSFYPDNIYDKKTVPRIFLTGIKIDNSPIAKFFNYISGIHNGSITQITVPFNKAGLILDYTALDYSNAEKQKYAYRLKGWDKDWNFVNNTRAANYSHLSEGSYTFYVKVMNTGGLWSTKNKLLSIIVLPPWYRTWWAYLLCVLATAGVVYIFLLYYKRQERLRYEVKLALVEKENEKELTERKIAFFTHISHEFRTPLTLIVNPLKDLVADSVPDVIRKKVITAQRNTKRLLSLVDQLLLFRKVESIDQQLRHDNFDIQEACNEVFLSFTQLAASKNIQFSFHPPASTVLFNGDKEKIEIILFNLLSNALKYTQTGGAVALSIAEDDKTINIIVSDTGCGIPRDVEDKLFDSFYQTKNTHKASQTGFGIGLYVSQKLAIAHSGRLSYTSEEGEGSAFTLSLPQTKVTENNASGKIIPNNGTLLQELVENIQNDVAEDENEIRDNSSKVIDKVVSGLPAMVIADDDAGLRSYIKDIFKDRFIIYETDDGIPAYEIINKEIPDIVISDVVMKEMNGIELCGKLKENSGLAHIPVILLTGGVSEQSRLKGIECGAEDYINKPFDKDLIIARVQNILKSRSRLQQYFFNTVTLQPVSSIDADQKEFLERCIQIIEKHIDDPDFTIQLFCREIGMSHPTLYKKIRAVSGLTVNVFIRYLRLRKAAELLINTNKTIVEVTYITGFNSIKYFREQFSKLFGMNPSEYVRRYRKPFGNKIS